MVDLVIALKNQVTQMIQLVTNQVDMQLHSRTFSPELEVAEGAGSSPDARNLEATCERVVTTSTGTSPSSWPSTACIARMSASVRAIDGDIPAA